MRRRGAASGEDPPVGLLVFRVGDWPGPDEAHARTAWRAARRAWARQARSLDAVNALYGPGFDPGVPDPRAWAAVDRRLTEALTSTNVTQSGDYSW